MPTPGMRRLRVRFGAQVAVCVLLGLLLGLVAREHRVAALGSTLTAVATLFISLLKLSVPPLVVSTIVVAIEGMTGISRPARLALRTLLWFLVTSLLAVAVAVVLGVLTSPGRSAHVDLASAVVPRELGMWTGFIRSLVDVDPGGASLESKLPQIVALGIVAGAGLVALDRSGVRSSGISRWVLVLSQRLVGWIIRLTPLGTVGLVGRDVAYYGWDLLAPLTTYVVDMYVGCLVIALGIYPLLLVVAARLNPLPFFAHVWPAVHVALVTRSSVASLPVTHHVVTQRLGVSRDYAAFVLPVAAISKNDGSEALYPALSAIFIAQVYGVPLHLRDYLVIALISAFGSLATAGASGGLVMLTLTLTTLGLPLQGAGLLLAIDPIIDIIRTATNVAGQALVPVLVAAREGLLDRQAYGKRSGAPSGASRSSS